MRGKRLYVEGTNQNDLEYYYYKGDLEYYYYKGDQWAHPLINLINIRTSMC